MRRLSRHTKAVWEEALIAGPELRAPVLSRAAGQRPPMARVVRVLPVVTDFEVVARRDLCEGAGGLSSEPTLKPQRWQFDEVVGERSHYE